MQLENVEDIYTLSPVQQGMLFHTLYDEGTGTYVQQAVYTLEGLLDAVTLQQAWQRVLDRHPALRTIFFWQDLGEPIQVVRAQMQLPWVVQDWRHHPEARQEELLEMLLEEGSRAGFALDAGPLMSCTLLRLAEERHWLVWSHHHILLDGWSIGLLMGEVFALYDALRRGETPQLSSPPPYRAYIAWLQEQDLAQAAAFWQTLLQRFSSPTSLPAARAGQQTTQASAWRSEALELPPALTAQLKVFAQAHHLTLNTLVQAAWALLLSRYSGSEDVVFGVTTAGRPAELAGVETMIGLFINTLPARVQTPGQAALLPWLQAIQAQQIQREQYAYSPLVEVQGWSEVPRGLPLFESLLVFENMPAGTAAQVERSGLTIRDIRYDGHTNYPLTIAAVPGPTLFFDIQYDTSRFAQPTIARLLGQLQTILHGMIARPGQRLRDIPWVSAAEYQQLIAGFNQLGARPMAQESLPELFERQAAKTQDHPALVLGEQVITYAELNARAEALACRLRAHGVGPEVFVALYLERAVEMIVGLLAVLKAGGVVAPLDPDAPAERLRLMLAQLQPAVILSQTQLAATLPPGVGDVLCLDAEPAGQPEAQQASRCRPHPQQLAYAIFTSGSTGVPKAVLVPHAAIAAHCLAACAHYAYTEADRVLQFAVLHFDAALEQILPALLAGATLVLRGNEVWNADQCAALITAQQLTVINFPTAYWHQVIDEWRRSGGPRDHRLRLAIVGGEAMQPKDVDVWESLFGRSVRLLNAYGPTEAIITATTADVLEGERAVEHGVPIGRPLGARVAYVLDADGNPVPVGVQGELYLGGDLLARGYHGQPALTAERFRPDPFSHLAGGLPGARLYRTGDLAHYLPDGQLVFDGRVDHQIKLRGFRIELGEIESTLGAHPGVREVVVILHGVTTNEQRIVAYVVPQVEGAGDGSASHPISQSDLRSYLATRLPDYMIPAAIVLIERLPVTSTGKLDRRALPDPASSRVEDEAPFVAPRTFVEVELATMWADLLQIDQVSVFDNFFALGGHSLLVMQLASSIREKFQVDVPLRALFDAPTVVAMSTLIAEQLVAEEDAQELEALLQELQNLSPDELNALLQTGE